MNPLLPPLATLFFLGASALPAGEARIEGPYQTLDPWSQVLEQVRSSQAPHVSTFWLCYPKAMDGLWMADLDLVRLRMGGELGIWGFPPGAEEALKEQKAWGPEPRWVLVGPRGEVLSSGLRIPSKVELRTAMESTGWRSRWDLRAEFLRKNPDHGDAWADEVREQARAVGRGFLQEAQIRSRLSGEKIKLPESDTLTFSEKEDARVWGAVDRALEGLMRVEGWSEWPKLGISTWALRLGGAKGSGLLRARLENLRREVRKVLPNSPSSESLWMAWETAAAIAGSGEAEALLASLEPLPRQPWPPRACADTLLAVFKARDDWGSLEKVSGDALSRAKASGVAAFLPSETKAEVLEAWVPLQVLALLKQGKRQEAMGIMREARHAAGQAWPELSNAIRSQNPVEESVPSSLPPSGGDPKQQRVEWEALLQLPKLRESPPPVPPAPLRVVLLGHPVWEKDWQRLRSAPALDDWEPGQELGWEGLELKEERDLRGREGWSEDSRWVLLRGDQVLDFGTDGLTPDALADRLRAFGEPYLVQLERFLKRHPDHREARLARQQALRARMPNLRLEARLLADARTTLASFEPGDPTSDWKPLEALWAPAARRVVPDLEAKLGLWPEDVQLWEAWCDWSSVQPRPPSPSTLLGSLSVWKTRLRGGAGPLPDEVGVAVARRLSSQGRWEALAEWGLTFWKDGLHEAFVQAKGHPVDPENRPLGSSDLDRMQKELIHPAREALRRTGRLEALRVWDQDFAALNVSLPKER